MMKCGCAVGRRARHLMLLLMFLLMLLTLLCFEGLFYTLYAPSAQSHRFSNGTSNCNHPKEGGGGEDESPAGRRTPDHSTVVLIWWWPFGRRAQLQSCSELFQITGCRLTADRSEYEKADGVMFHHRDIQSNLSELLRMRRPPLQKWVWMNMESPGNSRRRARLDGLFNLTSSYRRDSDVWIPYGRIVEASEERQKTFEIPPKDKLVCWIVNSWNSSFRRVRYYRELSKHLTVHTYGGAFKRPLGLQEYHSVMSSCKFYLSFENSVHKDYITEKLFNPMRVGAVPVVLGPPRGNYEELVPSGSFIHVDDFKSPQELAEHLVFLDQNQGAYEQFFSWRQHFTAECSHFGLEHACRICDHIRRHKVYTVVQSLSKWFWG